MGLQKRFVARGLRVLLASLKLMHLLLATITFNKIIEAKSVNNFFKCYRLGSSALFPDSC